MYSLVNVATLVRDLARLDTGDAVAADLLLVMALDDAVLAGLDRISVGGDEMSARQGVLVAQRERPRALSVLATAREVATDMGLRAYSAASDLLEQAPMFGTDELVRFVRHEVLASAWTGAGDLAVARWPRALDVVCDGIVASWTGDATVGGCWRGWVRRESPAAATPARSDVLDVVRALPRDATYAPVPASWAASMHEACWALHLTGRTRDAAVVQLHALRALLAAHAPARPPLRAVATVTAAVHASLVADVLDTNTFRAMTQPLFRLVP